MTKLLILSLLATLCLATEPDNYIWGKCIGKDFWLPCKVSEQGIVINGKLTTYLVIDVIIVDGIHQFMVRKAMK